jgi:hypothetical protein
MINGIHFPLYSKDPEADRLPSGGEIGLYQPTHPTAMEIP